MTHTSPNTHTHTQRFERLPRSSVSSMDTLMSLELLSLFSTERQSCCAAWTILCFPSSGDRTFTVGLHDNTDRHADKQSNDGQKKSWFCVITVIQI